MVCARVSLGEAAWRRGEPGRDGDKAIGESDMYEVAQISVTAGFGSVYG